ncbi:FAD-dependent oxidoreductase [Daejeonella sp.]|uniref:NAD(P)/FAD-dependent oxidoreductase n=1 Tax=Daejeonella sp. TaxID=2805397 RepID=UPI0030BC7051
MPQNIVIIGNGIAGITCARNIRKQSNNNITVISSETEHFYSRTALMYIYMGHMKYEHTKPYEDWFWEKNRIQLVNDHVISIDVRGKNILLQKGTSINYDKLVIATGSVSNKPDFPGINLSGVQSLYGMTDLELMNENTKGIKRAVIIGGGLIGIEMAEMLLSRNIHVTFLIREDAYWNNILPPEEAELISRHIKEHHVDLRTGTELNEIKGDRKAISLITNKGEEIACEFVGVTVGVSPNISIVKNTEIETDRGVLVTEFFETNIPDVYAIGDCVQHRNPPVGRKPVEQVWYTGKMHGETLAQTICGKKAAYNPGPWFNSAKFFDIEYQTYGTMNAKPLENESSFYWEHQGGKICFRVVYDKKDETLIGINVLGIRLRHEICDKWLQEKRKIDDVMANLHQLNFDPEFFTKHDKNILLAYNHHTGKNINRKKKRMSLFN